MTYAGVRWMTSRGNEELAAKAKHTLEAAVIGIIITVSAYAISNFVLSRLGGGSAGGGTAGGGAGASVTLCEKTYKAIGKNYFALLRIRCRNFAAVCSRLPAIATVTKSVVMNSPKSLTFNP